MKNGYKVDGGDRLAKTIIFARNHEHAQFIKARFNHHYPDYKGHFARIIDIYAKYPQSLIEDFYQKDKAPHIAISVDMLDTGIDAPEVANLVFFKPVYSRIKFLQMIGRGTRPCPELFGPDADKTDFRVFDFCFNFDFFRENPRGIEAGGGLRDGLADGLHGEVTAMNRENFIVRMHLEAVEKFRNRRAWDALNESDRETLQREMALLPTERETDDIASRQFDLAALNMQLALAETDAATLIFHPKILHPEKNVIM